MSAQHTPGPWHFAAKDAVDPTCPEFIVVQGTGYLATVDSSRDENSANARLIAAAPELLEALQNLTEWHLSGPEPTRFWDAARAAIAKATGGAA